jgi:predicted CXXCH cytochrome family protein
MEGKWRIVLAATLAVALSLLLVPVTGSAAEKAVLADADCVKCHVGPPADVERAGGAHKDTACTECHESHRPMSKSNIPKCSQCHEGKAHYQLKDCLTCHKNPHAPLDIILANNLTEPCLGCHADQIKQLRENKSKHTALFCTACHDVHRKVPLCTKCHKPHGGEMSTTDCKKCHKAHKPTMVAYGAETLNKDCASCHKKAMDLLSATASKHKTVTCVACHKEKHKTVPPCAECHKVTHPAGILAKFPKCSDCHNIAHDLNSFPAAVKPGAAPKPAAPPAGFPKPQ